MLDIGLIFTESLVPRASTKVESHASFTESRIKFFAMLNTMKLGKTLSDKYLKERQSCFLKADKCATPH